MKILCAAATAASLIGTSTLLTGFAGAAPLAPGEPAGLAKAQDAENNTVLYILGLGAIAAGIAIAASSSSNHGAISSTSSSGTTSGGGTGSGGGTTTTTTT